MLLDYEVVEGILDVPNSIVGLNRTTQLLKYFAIMESQSTGSQTNSSKFILKVMVQKSTGKLLYAQAKKDFLEFLFSLFYISLGEVENLMAGKTSLF